MALAGHSGSKLYLDDGCVRKESAYLAGCSEEDFDSRKTLLLTLVDRFPHIPRIRFPQGRTLEMDFIEGREGLEAIDPGSLGAALGALHRIHVPNAPVMDTGIDWLIDLATRNLARIDRTLPNGLASELSKLPCTTLVHGEPSNVITTPNGHIFFIDWDQCGLSSEYVDLGHVYRHLENGNLDDFGAFLRSYRNDPVDMTLVRKMAALGYLAYAG